MGLVTKIMGSVFKRQNDPAKIVDAATAQLYGAGTYGEKPWPFRYDLAVQQCRSWVYRCAMGNATAAASIPLRQYVRAERGEVAGGRFHKSRTGDAVYCPATGKRIIVKTRPVHQRRRRYLTGLDDWRPSRTVHQKLAMFGDDFEEVFENTPVLDVLRTANPVFNGFDLSLFRFLMCELTGSSYMHPVMSADLDRPVQLWPMLSQWMWVVPGEEGTGELIRGYVYGESHLARDGFTPDEVLPSRYPNPENLFYGLGKVEACWQTLGLHNSERVMQKALFDNHARPDWLLTVKGSTPDQVDRWSDKVNGLLRGVHKAGSMLALSGDVTAQPLAFAPKDLGSTESVVEEIAGVFGYPVTKLKANDPNRSNAETGDAGWMKDTILPMLRVDEEALNQNGYLDLFQSGAISDDVVLAYDDPVPANRKLELAESKTLVAMGDRTVNEDRELRGDAPMPGGDELRVNGQSVRLMDELMRAQIEQAKQPAGAMLPGLGLGGGLPGLFSRPEPVEEDRVDPTDIAAAVVRRIEDVLSKRIAENGTEVIDPDKSGKMLKRVGDVYVDDDGLRWTVIEERADGGVSERIERCGRAGSPGGVESDAARDDGSAVGSGPPAGGGVDGREDKGVPDSDDADDGDDAGAERHVISHRALMWGEVKGCTCHDESSTAETGHSKGGPDDGASPDHSDAATQSDSVSCRPAKRRNLHKRNVGEVTKADADDSVRDDEPELPGDRMARVLRSILADMQATVLSIIGGEKTLDMGDGKAARRIRTKVTDSDIEALQRALLAFGDRIEEELTPIYRDVLEAGGEVGLDDVSGRMDSPPEFGFNVTNPEVERALRGFTEPIKTTLVQTTVEGLRNTLSQAIDAGETIQQMSQRVRDAGVFSPQRAETIARSESARAYVQGEIEAWKQTGVVQGKQWLLAPQACEFCRAAAKEFNGKIVDLDGAFYAKGTTLKGEDGGVMKLDYADVTGPPLHPNDRCDVVPVLKEIS